MEENVALDSNKQKQFVKSIKGIKKLIKKNATGPKLEKVSIPEGDNGKKKRKFKERGLVYLSHIPHGFYEHQMTQYFKQFGKVTNVRVIRSKKTGNSKGCAFVEFGEPAVAQIVAETMNNYLMGKRLIKAEYVPPEKQRRHAMRKHWNAVNNPGNEIREKLKKAHNENKTEDQDLKKARKILKNLAHTKKKLAELGIDYDFFNPVDIPEGLSNETGVIIKEENKQKEKTQDKKVVVDVKKNGAEKVVKSKEKVKIEPKKAALNQKLVEQKGQKQQKLKGIGVKPPENFIKIAQSDTEDDDDSDGSLEFDSDEFEKAQEFDDEFGSDDGSESAGEDSNDDDEAKQEDDEESSEEEATPKLVKSVFKDKSGKKVPQPQPTVNKKNKAQKSNKQDIIPSTIQKNINKEIKRKAAQKIASPTAKKQKFEKKVGNQNKIFKKKK